MGGSTKAKLTLASTAFMSSPLNFATTPTSDTNSRAKMMIQLYLPKETTALSLGAQEVAESLLSTAAALGREISLTRTGSRGLFWLEPLLEVDTPAGRVAYGPLTTDDIDSILALDLEAGVCPHPRCLGLTEQIPYLAKQQRLTFSKAGVIDPGSISDYYHHHGYVGLKKFIDQDPTKNCRPGYDVGVAGTRRSGLSNRNKMADS